jgi:4a-hydroxytetrahydrobiopterin dehydratase
VSEPVLSPAEVDGALAEQGLHWSRSGDVLTTTVALHDFAAALAFVNTVGAAAEAANHHPDIDIRWNTVHLVLTTHSAGGLTLLDLALAGAVDRLRPDVREQPGGAGQAAAASSNNPARSAGTSPGGAPNPTT